jgi:hypothetical protein
VPETEDDEEEEYEKPEIVFPDSSFPIREQDIVLETTENLACQTFPAHDGSQGNPVVHCDFIDTPYDEWVAGLDKPFPSKGRCELS